MVDALDSGSSERKFVEVRVFSWAPEYRENGKKYMKIYYHRGDLPAGLDFGHSVAVDTEAMGLYIPRDRLTLVQLSSGNGECHLVHFPLKSSYEAPH